MAGLAGNLAILAFHPLESVKVRLQANDGHVNNHLPYYKNVWDVFRQMYRNEGLTAFYRGVYINMIGNTMSNMLFFTLYADGKKRYNYS